MWTYAIAIVTLEETLGPGRSRARLHPRPRTPADATATTIAGDGRVLIMAPLAHWPRMTLEETLGPGRSLGYNPRGGAGPLSTAAATT